ncbi:hypothetical protein Ancab_014709 [Ancistrocladus abbreviatus]
MNPSKKAAWNTNINEVSYSENKPFKFPKKSATGLSSSARKPMKLFPLSVFLQVREGGYDYKVNETINVVTAKTTKIGQRTWGIMKGAMALAMQKVEEYSKDSGPDNSKIDSSHQNENERDGYHRDFNHDTKGWNPSGVQQSSGRQFNSVSSGSWDD